MKYSFVSVALAAAAVDAFPALLTEAGNAGLLGKRQAVAPQGAGALPATPPPFDATAQYISTSGQYQFVPPGPGDARGQCPGLNAMANHGYLPHNGLATIQQFFDATQKVFGMAPDLAGFLALYGGIVDGNGAAWSIAGTPHVGIAGSHGNYEGDSSPLHADLNQYGSIPLLVLNQYKRLAAMQPDDPSQQNYNLEVMRAYRGYRFNESIAKNPLFTYNPFAGIEVSQAAFTFVYRFMANKSAAAPEGILNRANLKSFYSIYGSDQNPYWIPGWNKIPNNWYKRNDADQYSIPYFQADILYFAETVPQVFDVGCNQGRVNTYNSISPEVLTDGAYTSKSVAANPLCYASAYATYGAQSLFGLSSAQSSALTAGLAKLTAGMNCPTVTSFNNTALQACPGASIYGGPVGPVAPGAIQN